MKKPRVKVSDHALLRYLERVGGFDIERLRAEIGHRLDQAADMGATGITIDGFLYRIASGDCGPVVVTVLLANSGTSENPKGRK